MKIKIRAYAKLNLFLDITGRLPSGRHSLNIATQSVDVYDDITVRVLSTDNFGCRITCDNPDIPCDERNIVWKAARAYFDATDMTAEISVDIEKHVPLMGGMGGSSVDGAGTLVALNELFGKKLDTDALCAIGDKIGADVPICLKGGTQYSISSGDMITAECEHNCVFLCVYPDFTLSTAEAYAKYDENPTVINPDYADFVSSIVCGSLSDSAKYISNVFTEIYHNRRIDEIKNDILSAGAITSEMTGSGSVVFGIFKDEKTALQAQSVLSAKYPHLFVARPTNCGISVIER